MITCLGTPAIFKPQRLPYNVTMLLIRRMEAAQDAPAIWFSQKQDRKDHVRFPVDIAGGQARKTNLDRRHRGFPPLRSAASWASMDVMQPCIFSSFPREKIDPTALNVSTPLLACHWSYPICCTIESIDHVLVLNSLITPFLSSDTYVACSLSLHTGNIQTQKRTLRDTSTQLRMLCRMMI